MNQVQKAIRFAELHTKAEPIRLYNAWDAGSAKTIAEAGAKAIATSSWAVAAAQGYRDGQIIPIKFVEEIVARVVSATELPVTVDFEGGYSEEDSVLSENISRLLEIGVVGINFEDRVVGGEGLYPPDRQANRIAAIRKVADRKGIDLFINARSDIFFGPDLDHARLFEAALRRAGLYGAAGASGVFVPGLIGEDLIRRLCANVQLPVNVMVMKGVAPVERLIELGVSRISYGNMPYANAMTRLGEEAAAIFSAK